MRDLRNKIMTMRTEVKKELTKHNDQPWGENKKNYLHTLYVDNGNKSDIEICIGVGC